MYKIVRNILKTTKNYPEDERRYKAIQISDMIKLTEHQRKQLLKALDHEANNKGLENG